MADNDKNRKNQTNASPSAGPAQSGTQPDAGHHDLKPGSSVDDAHHIGGKGDFGVPESNRVERAYASRTTLDADHGRAQPWSRETLGRRESGAMSHNNGPGSGSGGDLDTSVLGLDGSGLAQNIDPHPRHTAADTDGSRDPAASGKPARGANQTHVGEVATPHPLPPGSVAMSADDRTDAPSGSDAVSHPDAGEIDDSFRGEISAGEASGADEAGR